MELRGTEGRRWGQTASVGSSLLGCTGRPCEPPTDIPKRQPHLSAVLCSSGQTAPETLSSWALGQPCGGLGQPTCPPGSSLSRLALWAPPSLFALRASVTRASHAVWETDPQTRANHASTSPLRHTWRP